jgi:hypothetical protein
VVVVVELVAWGLGWGGCLCVVLLSCTAEHSMVHSTAGYGMMPFLVCGLMII